MNNQVQSLEHAVENFVPSDPSDEFVSSMGVSFLFLFN
jgi:hypothetical protein